MDLLDDSKSKPSLEEDIEELRWMTRKEVYHALENSYKSIRFVFEKYYKVTEKMKWPFKKQNAMKQKFKDQIKGILIVPLGVAIVLIPFSRIIGWNLVTLIYFGSL